MIDYLCIKFTNYHYFQEMQIWAGIIYSSPSGTTLKSDNYLIFNGYRIVVFYF